MLAIREISSLSTPFARETVFLGQVPIFRSFIQLAWLDCGLEVVKMAIEITVHFTQAARFALLHYLLTNWLLTNRFFQNWSKKFLVSFGVTLSVPFVLCGAAKTLQAAPRVEAFVGQPFGVASVTIDVLRGEPLLPLSDERFTILEANGRVFYPVLKQQPVRKIVRGLLGRESPRKVTISFLFQGEEPFDLSAFTPHEQGVRVKPLRKRSIRSCWSRLCFF